MQRASRKSLASGLLVGGIVVGGIVVGAPARLLADAPPSAPHAAEAASSRAPVDALDAFAATLPPPRPPAAGDAAWRVVKVEGGITVRTAPSTGKPPWGSAAGAIDAPPARVLAHLLDFAAAPKLVPRLAEARVLRRSEPRAPGDVGEAVVYFFLDLPWPISNRDYTARFRWRTEPTAAGDEIVITVEDDNREGPPERGAIRVGLLRGLWRLRPLDGGRRTDARYDFLGDFGGMMTRSMIEQTDWKNPLETIQGVRKALR